MRPEKIISGGQTGADRAGLDAARGLGIPTGGFAPKGWRICLPSGSEGSDPSLAEYGLVETDTANYETRTQLNTQTSCGTVWFGTMDSSGAKQTLTSAQAAGKPIICNPNEQELREWVKQHHIKILNVAGNRASIEPTVYQQTFATITNAFRSPEDALIYSECPSDRLQDISDVI
jgi:hypothetical protein